MTTPVVYNCFFLRKLLQQWEGELSKSTESNPMLTYIFQDQYFIFPLRFNQTTHSASLRKASRSNPRPHFSNCMQNDVTSVHRCWSIFAKKTIAYYWTCKINLIKGKCYCPQLQIKFSCLFSLFWFHGRTHFF